MHDTVYFTLPWQDTTEDLPFLQPRQHHSNFHWHEPTLQENMQIHVHKKVLKLLF